MKLIFISILLACSATFAQTPPLEASPPRVLFVGNSFTYVPGEPNDPALPKEIQKLGASLPTPFNFEYEFYTQPGFTMKAHFDNQTSWQMLATRPYNFVVLQGQSIEALELPDHFRQTGGPVGRSEFVDYMGRYLSLAKQRNVQPVLFVQWTYDIHHPFLQDDFAAGSQWWGRSLLKYQDLLQAGYVAADKDKTARLALVGKAWQEALARGVVRPTQLYQDDFYHPRIHGTYLAAAVLLEVLFQIPAVPATYHPPEITEQEAQALRKVAHDVVQSTR